MSAGADTSLLAERFQARERSTRIGWLALAQGARARIVGAAVRILLLARPAEELRGAGLVPPHAQALFQPVSQLVARRGLARAAGALQVHGASRSKDHECNDHRQPIYPNLSDSDSVVGGQVASGDRFVADLGRDRAILGEEAVERALHIVFGVQLGSDPAERQPAPPPARVPEQVLAQLPDGRQLRLARIELAVLVPSVRPVRPGTRSVVGVSEAMLSLLVLD